jgi:hypothetical protein
MKEIKISPGNSKLGRIPNTSVIPVSDCKDGVPCKDKCYALKAWKQYPNVRSAWTNNSKLWRDDPYEARSSVIRQLKRMKKVKYFRIHVAGDFINQTHLDVWSSIARRFPAIKFRAFTKRFDLNYGFIPANLIIGFSMWPGCKDRPPKIYDNMPKAWVQDGTETRIPQYSILCMDDCNTCKVCWDNPPRHIHFDIH